MERLATLKNRSNWHLTFFVMVCLVMNIDFAVGQGTRTGEGEHSLAICQDGTVIGFGNNSVCQMGNGSTSSSYTLPQDVTGFGNAVSVSVGEAHSLALKDDGTVWAWGKNNYGCVGVPTSTTEVCTPTQVELPGCAVAISAGANFSLALLADGTIYAWGYNIYGQLGNGSNTTNTHVPGSVSGIGTATAIAAGGRHAMALLLDKTVKVWGHGNSGQMGNGTSGTSADVNFTPITATATGFSDIVKIAAGYDHCMALKSNNDIYLWGENFDGQLGRGPGNFTDSSNPLKSTGMSGSTVIDISAGLGFSIALRSDNKTRVCGANGDYELGYCKNFNDQPDPIFGPTITGAIDLWTPSTGQHTLCITSNGSLYGWGSNNDDQLGIGGSPSKVCKPTLINDADVIELDGYYCLAKPSEDNHPQPCCVAIEEGERTKLVGNYENSPNNIYYTGQELAITGPITLVSGNHYLIDCDVVCTANASITINSGARLYIQSGSHLYACDEMWQGIDAKNGSRIYVQSGSIIEDAETAVDIEYGTIYTINTAIFNKNYIHIDLHMPPTGSPNPADHRIVKSKFLCQISSTDATHTTLLPPHAGGVTFMSIRATDVPKLLVGSSSISNANNFDNTGWGIYADAVDRTEVLYNNFTDLKLIGVHVLNGDGASGSHTIDIDHNNIDRIPYGIICYDNDTTVRAHITYNDIDFAGMTNPPVEMVGITVSEVTPASISVTANYVDISHNTISNAPSGIHLENMRGNRLSPAAKLYVGDNVITHTKDQSFNAGSGIKTNNVSEIAISNNIISHPTGAHHWWESSIRISGGNENSATCNFTYNHGRAIVTDNDIRFNSHFVKNEFRDYEIGFFMNHSKIGDQVDAIGRPFDNQWISSWGTNDHIMCYGSSSNGLLSLFTVRNTGSTYYPTNRSWADFGVAVPTPTTTGLTGPTDCPYVGPAFKTDGSQELSFSPASQALQILEEAEGMLTEIEEATNWNARFNLYSSLQRDDELLYAEEALQAFATEQEQGNIGKLYRAMAVVNGNDATNAETVAELQAVEPTNRAEYTIKQVLEVLLAEHQELNDDDDALLREVAQRCPIDDGFGVFIARAALLKIDTLPRHYTSDCERLPSMEEVAEKQKLEEVGGFLVYPNPASAAVTIVYTLGETETGLVLIYDVSGSLVFSGELQIGTSTMSLDVSTLTAGLYLLQIQVDGLTALSERVSVIK